jgi:hypothetical protein
VKAAIKKKNYEVLGVSADIEMIDIDDMADDYIIPGEFPGVPGAAYGERTCQLFFDEETQKLTVDCSKDWPKNSEQLKYRKVNLGGIVMAKSSYRIKLSSAMRPYVGRVVRNGAVQRAFAKGPGATVGACVARNVNIGMSGGAIKDAVRQCAKSAKGIALAGNFKRGDTIGRRAQQEYNL